MKIGNYEQYLGKYKKCKHCGCQRFTIAITSFLHCDTKSEEQWEEELIGGGEYTIQCMDCKGKVIHPHEEELLE